MPLDSAGPRRQRMDALSLLRSKLTRLKLSGITETLSLRIS